MSYQGKMMPERYINAAKDGYLDVLQQATKRDLNTPDEDGMTAVMWAAHNGHLDALRLIVGRGGDVDRCDYLGLTPLHHAARKGLLHVVTYLVNWGANIFALDNDHHSALDLASLYQKTELVHYLDTVYAQQQSKNPKHASRLREEALKQAERNVRRYEKLQEEAARRAQKEQRKLTTNVSHDSVKNGGGHGTGQGKNFIKSLTMAIRGSKTQGKTPSASGKSYSDIAGLSHTTGGQGGIARRISRRRSDEINGDGADFKISDLDETGKRTLRSVSNAQGVRGMSSEVMYMAGQQGVGAAAAAGDAASRPAVYDVFEGQGRSKVRSETELLDSGVDSYFGDEEDEEETTPGMFNRPGFGKTAFLTGSNFLNTLPSFDGQAEGDGDGAARSFTNGQAAAVNGSEGASEDMINVLEEYRDAAWHQSPKELPWDQEEVDTLDDDDEGTTASALETFLWSAGLETYLHKFLQEKVDMEVLVKMSDADLKEIGLPFGPRKRLLEAVKRRQDVLSLPKHITDSFL